MMAPECRVGNDSIVAFGIYRSLILVKLGPITSSIPAPLAALIDPFQQRILRRLARGGIGVIDEHNHHAAPTALIQHVPGQGARIAERTGLDMRLPGNGLETQPAAHGAVVGLSL